MKYMQLNDKHEILDDILLSLNELIEEKKNIKKEEELNTSKSVKNIIEYINYVGKELKWDISGINKEIKEIKDKISMIEKGKNISIIYSQNSLYIGEQKEGVPYHRTFLG